MSSISLLRLSSFSSVSSMLRIFAEALENSCQVILTSVSCLCWWMPFSVKLLYPFLNPKLSHLWGCSQFQVIRFSMVVLKEKLYHYNSAFVNLWPKWTWVPCCSPPVQFGCLYYKPFALSLSLCALPVLSLNGFLMMMSPWSCSCRAAPLTACVSFMTSSGLFYLARFKGLHCCLCSLPNYFICSEISFSFILHQPWPHKIQSSHSFSRCLLYWR